MRSGVLWSALIFLTGFQSPGQLIVADAYDVPGNGTGFSINSGINSGISPPATRLTGSAAPNLRYISTANKTNTAFAISGNKLRVTPAANPGRFTLSSDGITPFNFASALGSAGATPQHPLVYDLTIRMANQTPGVQRFSFALGTAEGDATTWDFGIQIYRTTASDSFYTIGKRIDTSASGLGADLNTYITHTAPGTAGSEVDLLMRVTDAGAETAAFNSRVQLSMDAGLSWFYDTRTDPDLPNGWRLDGPGRYILWDVAPDAGNVTYDDFSARLVPITVRLLSPGTNTANLGAAPTLKVMVSNTAPGNLTVTYFGRKTPPPAAGADFCIAVMPDTQNYAREAAGNGDAVKEMWFAQTEWLVTNRVAHNIAYLAHLGDCVQNGDIKNGSPNNTEWKNATNAMYRLENPTRTLLKDGIPYGIAVGNHDQEPIGEPDGASELYNKYFGISHFDDKAYYGGHFSTNNDNHFDLFSAGGLDFIVLYFEFGRNGSTIMNWANNVLATNQHRRAIAVTHWAGGDTTPCNHSPHGKAIFDGLKNNTNFFLLLGGHVFDTGGEGSRSDVYQGRTIRTFISNYQGRLNGGNGWMRLLYFSPSNNMVTIKTFSPWLNQYETDANSQMSFPYLMQSGSVSAPVPFVALGTNHNVPPGSVTQLSWPGRQGNTEYEWYAVARDNLGNQIISPIGQFRTALNSPPVATNRAITIVGDQPSSISLVASDSNGDALTYQTNSRPTAGLITEFDAASGSITYAPAHGYRGLDRFTFQASDSLAFSSVATVNLSVVAPTDADGNGLPDDWESRYGVSDPLADDDGDGQDNLSEFMANTNPTNAASALKIIGGEMRTDGSFALTWSAVGGTRYRVQSSDGSTTAGFVDISRPIEVEMDLSPYGAASTQSFVVPFSPTNHARYYRVRVGP